jgi:hypothetical protein
MSRSGFCSKVGPRLQRGGGRPIRSMKPRATSPVTQLVHASPTLTLGLYGAFIPSAEDRAQWRARVAEAEALRRAGACGEDRKTEEV